MPSLESLGLSSLSSFVLAFFHQLGIVSVEDFLVRDTYNVVALAENQTDAEQYKQAVADILLFLETKHATLLDGMDILALVHKNLSFHPTGCKSFDEILLGGFRDGTVTELFGPSSSGKTQEDQGLDRKHTALLVVDSISSLVSPVLSSSYMQGHALMMTCGHTLIKIANENNVCVLVTNHMVTGDNRVAKSALGESWKVVANARLLVSREAGSDICCVSLAKHSSMSCNKKAYFRLSRAGMQIS
ncbi:hypothetical protein KP509_28G047300 [Ceratopteris richardii]|uniref:Rad51-like C-terminal domain-containing protein n=1 Tax=Ceratopteris richardii TaxID=49495 RepID=A0A8T2RBT3_CERRI|nr:hypothetical protein KP509_28G047300 [Ceratopteris richardii]